MAEQIQTSQAQQAANQVVATAQQVEQKTVEVAQQSYSFWQKAKDFTRNNAGTVLGLAILAIFIIGVIALA